MDCPRTAEPKEARIKMNAKIYAVLDRLVDALDGAKSHLDYVGYGDSYERECAMDERLPELIDGALKIGREFLSENEEFKGNGE